MAIVNRGYLHTLVSETLDVNLDRELRKLRNRGLSVRAITDHLNQALQLRKSSVRVSRSTVDRWLA